MTVRSEEHIPVLLREAVDALGVKRGGRYIDGTFGRGGHSREIASRGGLVLGIDRDDAAIAYASELDEVKSGAIRVVKGAHGDLRRIANENGWNEVDGVLLDLGVSSPQLDEAGRGFSFLREGPLDMRMDRSQAVTAADTVNSTDAEELARIFREYGEEPQSRRIAKAIAARVVERGGFETTTELADFIEQTVGRHGGKHPATRIFQALRMAVNDECGQLLLALDDGMELLSAGGRMAVITFESLTDRMVKTFLSAHVGREESLQQGGSVWRGQQPRAKWVIRKAVVADEAEVRMNPRSRSAKLRAVEVVR